MLQRETNIDPIMDTMKGIAKTLKTVLKVLESELERKNQPDLETHMKVGVEESYVTGKTLTDASQYWSKVFISIGKIMQLHI